MNTQPATEAFEGQRKRLTGIAYRMLGRWSEAQDIVQDAWLRWQSSDPTTIQTPAAWLTTVTVRLCLDRIRRTKASREVYVGPWLPEPVLTPEGGERSDQETESFAGDLSLALMVVLERLGPEERAAFILREAFDASYADIATALGKREAAVRQLVSRARERVHAGRPRFPANRDTHQKLLDEFVSAVAANDASKLIGLFTSDVRMVSDGGGKRPAALRIINTPAEVARLMLHLATSKGGPRKISPLTLNGVPSLWFVDGQGFGSALQLEIVDNQIRAIFIIGNPDKLGHLH